MNIQCSIHIHILTPGVAANVGATPTVITGCGKVSVSRSIWSTSTVHCSYGGSGYTGDTSQDIFGQHSSIVNVKNNIAEKS